MTTTIFKTYTGVAHTWLCDEMGHMNTRHYVGMFDDAMQHFMLTLGHEAMLNGERRFGWADVRHEIDYLEEVAVGTLVHVNCSLVKVGNSSITYLQELIISDTGVKAAVNKATSVLFDLKTRKSAPISSNMRIKTQELCGV